MTHFSREQIFKKLEDMENMPSIPVTLEPLLRYLSLPVDELEVQKVVDMISHDKSLTVQCLHLANSPLFCRWQAVDSLRGAVVALGLGRMKEIALACSFMKMLPKQIGGIDPVIFWEHSLGCALVSGHLARKLSLPNAEKAYLAGLLHDFGIVANVVVLPKEFGEALDLARTREIPLHEAELEVLGVTHAESGGMLAQRWRLAPELITVISGHHTPELVGEHRSLVALVNIADLLCRMRNLGYGYPERRLVNLVQEKAFAVLAEDCPALRDFDWARLTFELDNYMFEVHRLVAALYRIQ
jgi:HD-like signal output (HDOD) protein